MKTLRRFGFIFGYAVPACILFTILILVALGIPSTDPPLPQKKAALQRLPIPFVEHQGRPERFVAQTPGGSTAITMDGRIVYALADKSGKACLLKETPVGGTEDMSPQGRDRLKAKATVFHGKEQKKTLAMYGSVDVGSIARGVDLTVRAAGSNVEKLFTVHPGADAGAIRVHLEGGSLSVSDTGELDVMTGQGKVSFTAPLAYQMDDLGQRKPVQVAYAVRGPEYGFSVGDYDRSRDLVIDPLLASTFVGGTGTGSVETAQDVAVDASGNVYVAGQTPSADFPVTDDGSYGGNVDGYILKLDSAMTQLEAAVFIGGEGYDSATSVILSNGKVYLAGFTNSADFPVTEGAYDSSVSGNDAFVCILNEDLDTIEAATLVGGSGSEQYPDMALGSGGIIYLAMESYSTDFPMAGTPYDSTHNASKNFYSDITIARLSSDLTTLEASTYLGGSGSTYGYGYENYPRIAIDGSGRVWVAGITGATDFPTTEGAFRRTIEDGYEYVFVSRLSAGLSTLQASTYLGATHSSYRIALAPEGNDVYVAGFSYKPSDDYTFPVTDGAYDTNDSGSFNKAFITRISGAYLSELVASTLLGGEEGLGDNYPNTYICDMAIDSGGNVVVAGITLSSDFPTTPNAYDTTGDYVYAGWSYFANPFFISRLDADLSTLLASTYLGNQYYGNTPWAAVAVDNSDNVYLCGMTASSAYPTSAGAYDTVYNGGDFDAFVSKLDSDLSGDYADLALTLTPPDGTVTVGTNFTYTLTVTNNGPSAATGVTFSHTLPEGVTFVSVTPSQGSAIHKSGTISANLGTIAPSGTVNIVITLTAPASAGTPGMTASVSSGVADPDSTNNALSSSVTVGAAALPVSDDDHDGGWCFIATARR